MRVFLLRLRSPLSQHQPTRWRSRSCSLPRPRPRRRRLRSCEEQSGCTAPVRARGGALRAARTVAEGEQWRLSGRARGGVRASHAGWRLSLIKACRALFVSPPCRVFVLCCAPSVVLRAQYVRASALRGLGFFFAQRSQGIPPAEGVTHVTITRRLATWRPSVMLAFVPRTSAVLFGTRTARGWGGVRYGVMCLLVALPCAPRTLSRFGSLARSLEPRAVIITETRRCFPPPRGRGPAKRR
jgi:hypothetical protein